MPARVESLTDFVVCRAIPVSTSLGEEGVVVQGNTSGHWEDVKHIRGISSVITDFIWQL